MTTLTLPDKSIEHISLHGVSWETYLVLLNDLADQHIQLTYDQGALEIMSPLSEHEQFKKIIGRMIEIMGMELNIPVCPRGSTTFKREKLKMGAEPDECYYIEHEPDVRMKRTIDLSEDPPPDLVIEIDITHRTIKKQPIYAAFGVPEIWRFNGTKLEALRRGKGGVYRPREISGVFPFLPMADVTRFLKMFLETDDATAARAWRDWVRENLVNE